jgi:hypothetical protein
MYEKIGLALAKIDKAEIHIAGFTSKNVLNDNNIEFHPLFNFNRLSPRRLLADWKIWKLLLQLKPEVIISNTHELLLVISLYRIIFGGDLIYDVQENYFKNLWFGKQFPPVIRHLLAIYVRLKERIVSPFIKSFLLAEKCYIQEMPFFASRGIVIENKFRKAHNLNIPVNQNRSPLKLVYTGTIAEIYGIFEAIDMAKSLLNYQDGTFTIIGQCPSTNILEQVKKTVFEDSRITLIGDDRPLPHSYILDIIAESNLGIMSYKQNPAIDKRIPTRVYEYMAFKLPFLFPEQASWAEIVQGYNAGIPINNNSFKAEEVLKSFQSREFYNSGNMDNLYFESYDNTLQKLILSNI